MDDITVKFLEIFDIPRPGVALGRTFVFGMTCSEFDKHLNTMVGKGLIEVAVAHDAIGDPYSGALIGLTQRGRIRLDEIRIRRRRQQSVASGMGRSRTGSTTTPDAPAKVVHPAILLVRNPRARSARSNG